MYLHLGVDTVVKTESILAVCDLDNTSSSHITRDYLRRAEEAGEVINVAEDLPKSFVVCVENGQKRVYLSQLNTATLLKRAENASFE
jgi:extracellular matrix regulatory protein B